MSKLIKYLSLFIIMFFISTDKVLASNHLIDLNKKGTINVTLKETNDKKIPNVEISIYHIKSVSIKDNKLVYTYNENIQDCKEDLNDLPRVINKCIINIEPLQSKLTNNEGQVKFEDLDLGLYLVKQTNEIKGYSSIEEFLVNIPQDIDNKWVYDIEALPKTDITRLMDIIVEKKWNVIDNENTPNYVTIELLKNNLVIDTVTLNKDNNWTHTWKQIEESDEYSVKEINIPKEYTPTYRQEGNKFIVTNTKTLVQTGQNTLIIELLIIIGLGLITIGIIYDKRNH